MLAGGDGSWLLVTSPTDSVMSKNTWLPELHDRGPSSTNDDHAQN